MIIATIILLLIVGIKVLINYEDWINIRPINHTKEWCFMAIAAAPAIYFYTMASSLAWYFAAPLSALMMAFFIWPFFDGLYNKVRGFNWWFTGSEDADDAKTDNFLQGLKLWQHVAIKVGGNILLIGLYIYFK